MNDQIGDRVKAAKDFAKAFSTQSKFSNRLWLALVAAAGVVNFPRMDPEGSVDLPFTLGSVKPIIFAPAAFFILAILTLAYFVAFAEMHNAAEFAIGRLKEKREAVRLFDFFSEAPFTRAAPLVYLGIAQLGQRSRKAAACYYFLLKQVAHIVVLGIPMASLVAAYLGILAQSYAPALWATIIILSTLTLALTLAAFFQVLQVNISYDSRTFKKYWNGELA